ncbi:MAG: hypothetical protein M3010_11050 [Candidatus Dormibacteraeota bacterium]|nr:hypothetical protein [Candidatus Dormibacteraeota bacterium]
MIAMKKYGLLAVGILLLGAALVVGATALPGVGPDRGNSNTGTNGYGYGSGGMMGGGPGGSGGMMGGTSGTPTDPNAPRLNGDQVRKAVTAYLDAYYPGQGLQIAEIMEFQNNFYAQLKEPAPGRNAFEVLIDPHSGNVWPEYGPNMMWNTKYGMMGGGAGGRMGRGMLGGAPQGTPRTADLPVTPQQAVQDAQHYLQAQGSTLTVESQTDTFYGYYTLHTLQDGKTAGMLSVNGYTGQVWYHTWHGPFIGMVGFGAAPRSSDGRMGEGT